VHDYIYEGVAKLGLGPNTAYKIGWHEHPAEDERSKSAQNILDFMTANNIKSPIPLVLAQKLQIA
jgi:hypothetical protein